MIDNRLVGLWENGGAYRWRLHPDGKGFSVAPPLPYEITGNDSVLRHLVGHPPLVFSRVTGAGSLVGRWTRSLIDEGKPVTEDCEFRGDGTMSWWLWVDGVADPEMTGIFIDDGSAYVEELLRSLYATGPGDALTRVTDGVTETGTYAVDPSGDAWTATFPGGAIRYTRAAP